MQVSLVVTTVLIMNFFLPNYSSIKRITMFAEKNNFLAIDCYQKVNVISVYFQLKLFLPICSAIGP